MVSLSLNLLPRRGAGEILRQRLFGKIKKGSVLVLVGYAVLLVAVFGARVALAAQKERLETDIRQAKVRIDAFATTESQQVLLKSKLQMAAKIFNRRRDWSSFMAEVLEFIPDERSVAEVSLTQVGDLNIRVQTSRLQEAAVMLKALTQLGLVHDQIKGVAISEVKKGGNGIYSFTVTITTKKT